ncbi:MAG: hypothetical protein HY457_02120 [Parcubacteria group bacterium]|nr:hypothetical protein [Parcubacteria group bacterium]
MKNSDYVVKSFINASGVFLYVFGVAWFLSNAQEIFGEQDEGLFVPIFMLLLFIISATITSLLVLGRPVYLYLNNQKKEAMILLLATLGWLAIFLFSVACILFFFQ